MAKTVDEIMNSDLFGLRPSDTAETALGYLSMLGVSGAPVLDREHHPLGVVSFRDLEPAERDEPVEGLMTSPAITTPVGTDIESVGRLMAERNIHRVPVVNESGCAVGIVSAHDVLLGILGYPASHPDTFPHHDPETGLSWTNDLPLDTQHAERAPSGPGVLVLRVGGSHRAETDVWAEAAQDVRARIDDLLNSPQPDRWLARILREQQGHLRYRVGRGAGTERGLEDLASDMRGSILERLSRVAH